MAGVTIGDNVGIGGQSQLWTHMIFGDVMAGSRFHSTKPLVIEADAWLVGHCLVSPARIGSRSVVMLGSVVTRDVPSDRVYAGVPARDVTETFGPPFVETTDADRREYFGRRLDEFCSKRGIVDVSTIAIVVDSFVNVPTVGTATAFNVKSRTYRKRGTTVEHDLIRFLLPEAKFLPEPQ
jgi:tetrahydrodipicolinate N-succinyltransferase